MELRTRRSLLSRTSMSNASFSPLSVAARDAQLAAARRCSDSCPITSSTSSCSTLRPSPIAVAARSSFTSRVRHSLILPLSSFSRTSHTPCSDNRFSSASTAASSASSAFPSSACTVAARLPPSASRCSVTSTACRSCTSTCARCRSTFSRSSASAAMQSRVMASSSACSCSCPPPSSLSRARLSTSSSLDSLLALIRMNECSSNSRTQSSSAVYSLRSCSRGVSALRLCLTRAWMTTRWPSSWRWSASRATRSARSSCTVSSMASASSLRLATWSIASRCVFPRASRTPARSFCTSCSRASIDTSEVRSASMSSSRRNRDSPSSMVSSDSSETASVRCAITCSVATALAEVSIARSDELRYSTLSWHASCTSSFCCSITPFLSSSLSMPLCSVQMRCCAASDRPLSAASISLCSATTAFCAVRFPDACSNLARMRSPCPIRCARARSSASTSADAPATSMSSSRYERRHSFLSLMPSTPISSSARTWIARRLATSCSPMVRSCKCLESRSCARCRSAASVITSLCDARIESFSSVHTSDVFPSTKAVLRSVAWSTLCATLPAISSASSCSSACSASAAPALACACLVSLSSSFDLRFDETSSSALIHVCACSLPSSHSSTEDASSPACCLRRRISTSSVAMSPFTP
mmetsp:Transcript_26886/g.64167  ORF Transcript_26886/g.64167 Transcript_26886/m.64167 type:complete len:647 (-) Transcript_26886:447-2387(-)